MNHVLENDSQTFPLCPICLQPITKTELDEGYCVKYLPGKPHYGCNTRIGFALIHDFEFDFRFKQKIQR